MCGESPDWGAILAGTTLEGLPLQTVTLQQVLALSPLPDCVASLDIGSIELNDSILGLLTPAALALGDTGLDQLPIGSSTNPIDDWCELLSLNGFDCVANNISGSSTIATLDILGAPVSSIPVSSIPVSSIPVS